MRLGIGATSGIRPKLFRMRFLPVNVEALFTATVAAISYPRPEPSCARRLLPGVSPANHSTNPPPDFRRRAGSAESRRAGPFSGPAPAQLLRRGAALPAGLAVVLLELDSRAGLLELLLELVRLVLADAFLDRLRRALDEILRLLQPERGDGADLLDDVDLLVAGGDEDDVELGLRLGHRRRRA